MATKNKDGSNKSFQQLLFEGLTDSLGFAGGAFLCYWLGTWMGFNMAMAGNTSTEGIFRVVVMLVFGGIGLKLARRLRNN